MRYMTGVIAILALAVGSLALFGELRKDADASVAARYTPGDERVNKCVQNGYNQTRAAPRLRGPMCERLIKRMDLRFTAAEGGYSHSILLLQAGRQGVSLAKIQASHPA